MLAEIDEDEAVLSADEDLDEDDDEESASIDDLGLPMPVLGVDEARRRCSARAS